MLSTSSSLEQNLESLSRMAATASKIGILAGAICVIGYSLRISHFPQDISVGDGFLFLMAAACFGAVYVLFIASFVALGIFLSPFIRYVVKLFVWGYESLHKRKIGEPFYEFAPFDWSAAIFSPFWILFMLVLGSSDSNAYWHLPLLSVSLYVVYSIYRSSGNKIAKIEEVNNSLMDTDEKRGIARFGNPQKFRRVQLFSLASILIVPLVISGYTGQLLDAAMRLANIRIEKPIIYVKEPYSSLIPKSAIATNVIAPKDYTAFDKTVVLFKGFGKTTVISIQDGVFTRRLEIPNDQVIVEDR